MSLAGVIWADGPLGYARAVNTAKLPHTPRPIAATMTLDGEFDPWMN